jgi:hypothetical protein
MRRYGMSAASLALALLFGFAPTPAWGQGAPPSSYAKSPGGTKVLYLFLEDLGYRMRRIFDARELAGNAKTPAADVALMVGPVGKRSARLALEWARAGKLLILAPALFDEGGHCKPVAFSSLTIERKLRFSGVKTKATIDGALELRSAACVMDPPPTARVLASTFAKGSSSKSKDSKGKDSKDKDSKDKDSKDKDSKDKDSSTTATAEAGSKGETTGALIFEHDVGKGKVLVLAHDDLLTNMELDRDDLAVIVRRWLQVNAPLRARVAYYELRQGGALWKMLKKANLVPLFFHGLLLLALVLWKITPRFGDADSFSPSRTRAFAEHARSLGTLYQRAGSSGYALSLLYERFRRRLRYRDQATGARQVESGPAGAQERAALAERLATRTGGDADSIESLLAQVEYASEQKQQKDGRGVMRDYRLAVGLCDLAQKAGVGEAKDT